MALRSASPIGIVTLLGDRPRRRAPTGRDGADHPVGGHPTYQGADVAVFEPGLGCCA